MRKGLLAACALLLFHPSSLLAQEWARKMFDRTSHNYGTVAKGAKAECTFVVTNLYKEDVHIASVRSSCGCASPQIITPHLKTYEKGEIIAQFNTRAFSGDRNATITVTFDKPFYAEVQLQVSGFIRTDVVLEPGGVDLGAVDLGKGSERTIIVNYAGHSNWQIVDVLSANKHLEASLKETSRGNGHVHYNLVVRLKPDAPVGYIKDQLTLVTNDQRSQQIPVDVEGRVIADLSVSPQSLFMGVLHPGEKKTKQLVVRGKQPFRIVGITCADGSFSFDTPDATKNLHLIPVTFVAGDKPGKVSQKIRIETDLGTGAVEELNAYAEIVQVD